MVSFYIQEVKIPGRKAFGFSYHSRLFVSAVEEGSAAADWLLPGDEIVQVSSYTLQRFQLDQTSLSFFSTPVLLSSSSFPFPFRLPPPTPDDNPFPSISPSSLPSDHSFPLPPPSGDGQVIGQHETLSLEANPQIMQGWCCHDNPSLSRTTAAVW